MATQTGSIDLTASNSVKLAAEAGWQSDLDDYYTKSEIDVTVGGIESDVTEIVDGLTQSSHFTQTATGFEFTLDDALADAEKTATNYIGIDSTGIRIANANPNTTTTYQHQSATSTEFIVDGNSMAEISGNGARFGVSAEPHLELSSSRMILTELNDSLNSRPRFDVNARDTYYSDPFDIPSSALSTGLTVKIAGGFVKVTPAALSIGDSSRTDESDATLLAGTSMVRVGKAASDRVTVDPTNGITIYKGNSKRLQTTANGIDVYGSDGTTSIASFGSTVTLASDDGNHLVLDGDELAFLDADDNRLFYIEPYDGDGIPEDSSVTLSTDSGWFVVDAGGLAYLRVGLDDIEMLVKKGSASQTALYASGSEVGVGQPLYAYSGVTATYQVAAEGTQNTIALRANSAGNRGLYDVTDGTWIVYKNVDGNIVINGDNFSVDASGLVNAGRKVVAAGNEMVALAASASSGSTNRGLWDETGGAWIIYRSTGGSIVLGDSVSDVLYRRESTCSVKTANATIYNNYNFCWNNGACCTVQLCVNLKSNLANASMVDVAEAPEGYRPPHVVFGSVMVTGQHINLQAEILGDGTIRVNNRSGTTVTSSANIYISFTFAP